MPASLTCAVHACETLSPLLASAESWAEPGLVVQGKMVEEEVGPTLTLSKSGWGPTLAAEGSNKGLLLVLPGVELNLCEVLLRHACRRDKAAIVKRFQC